LLRKNYEFFAQLKCEHKLKEKRFLHTYQPQYNEKYGMKLKKLHQMKRELKRAAKKVKQQEYSPEKTQEKKNKKNSSEKRDSSSSSSSSSASCSSSATSKTSSSSAGSTEQDSVETSTASSPDVYSATGGMRYRSSKYGANASESSPSTSPIGEAKAEMDGDKKRWTINTKNIVAAKKGQKKPAREEAQVSIEVQDDSKSKVPAKTKSPGKSRAPQ